LNRPPAANADALVAMEDAPGETAVLANDVDPDGDDLGVEVATQGEHGTVACSAGTCTYRPDADYHGADSFTYTVSDARGGSATGTVAVSVRSVNDAPVASDDSALVAASGTVVLDLSADDSPGPANEDGETLRVRGIASPPSYGVATPLPDGAVRYRPPEGYSGPDWLEYEVCDDGTTAGAPDPRCTVGSVRLRVQRVAATAETDPVPNAGDAADDAAIWVHPTVPSRSTLIGTDKGGPDGVGGLAVYDLAGTQLQYLEIGKMNNVDLRADVPLGGAEVDLVAASRRTGGAWGIALLRVDGASGTLVDLASPIRLPFEPYGLCLYRSAATDRLYAFVTQNAGTGHVEQWELRAGAAGTVDAARVRSFAVGSLSEGCVADDEHGALYIGEELGGIWRYSAEPDGGSDRTLVDAVGPGRNLAADVEALALATRGDGGGYLVAASQGDGRYVVYRRRPPNEFVRSFTVEDGDGVDGTQGIDGIAITTASLGPSFANGVLVSQDGTNTSPSGTLNQNFKLVPLELALGGGDVGGIPPRPTTCTRPYAASCRWNTPFGGAPTYDPDADITAFAGQLTSDPSQYTYPVYPVTSATPLAPVHLSGWYSDVTDAGTTLTRLRDAILGVTVMIPIPGDAEAAAGSDGQVIVVDPVTGDEWGFWQLERTLLGWSATNGYHYNTAWSGVPPHENGDLDKPFVSRGAGVPYLAGLVRPCELARGRIEHALAFAYDFPTAEYVFPATKSDGNAWDGVEDALDSHPGDVPEGTRLQLDPALSTDEIQARGCTGACLTIARALQEYGMYVIDNSSRPKVMLEYEGTARWNGVVDEDTVRSIPLNRLKVIAPGP
jgi:myo-inositol-hexaphosphate 3-phosphohydrolase